MRSQSNEDPDSSSDGHSDRQSQGQNNSDADAADFNDEIVDNLEGEDADLTDPASLYTSLEREIDSLDEVLDDMMVRSDDLKSRILDLLTDIRSENERSPQSPSTMDHE